MAAAVLVHQPVNRVNLAVILTIDLLKRSRMVFSALRILVVIQQVLSGYWIRIQILLFISLMLHMLVP